MECRWRASGKAVKLRVYVTQTFGLGRLVNKRQYASKGRCSNRSSTNRVHLALAIPKAVGATLIARFISSTTDQRGIMERRRLTKYPVRRACHRWELPRRF